MRSSPRTSPISLPAPLLAAFDIVAVHPDDFLLDQWDLDPTVAAQVLGDTAARQRPEVTVTEILDQLSPSRRTPVLRPRRAHPNPTPTGMRKGKSDPGTWSAESGPYSGERRQAEESIIRRRGHCPREHHRRPPTPLPRTPGAPWSAHRPCPTARARRGAVDTWSVLERHRCLLSRPVRIIGTAITLRVQRAGTGKRFRG